MTETVEKRRAFLINLAYIAVILALVFVFFKYFFWVAAPFLLSFFFAVLLQKPQRWLDKKTKHKCHTLWSILLVLLSISIILVPVIIILSNFIRQVGGFLSYLTSQLSDFPVFIQDLQNALLKFLSFLPDKLYSSVSESIVNALTALSNDFDLTAFGIDS